ncbi:MmcQ/YjbR family DNA-binding protein [Ekhidna sp. To15]|uniref:MmcQ/YjbR family DNA-binding protein n=1 Tax=Ekhidna sp. To15 TaxID=3395267 RepID=UPI003F528AD0
MNIEEFRDYCIAKPGTTEETPFGPDTLVFKVLGKMYALTGIDSFEFINLKCDPEYAVELREKYDGSIRPGYHMNKQQWNSVYTDGVVADNLIRQLIDDSYDLIVAKLPKKDQEFLKSHE